MRLASVSLPGSLASIGRDAFPCQEDGSCSVVFSAAPGSFAERYCLEHGLKLARNR